MVCQTSKHVTIHSTGLLQPLPNPHSTWLHISVEFIKELPLSSGFTVIFFMVDMLTKFFHFFPLAHPYTTCKVA